MSRHSLPSVSWVTALAKSCNKKHLLMCSREGERRETGMERGMEGGMEGRDRRKEGWKGGIEERRDGREKGGMEGGRDR